MEVHHHPHAEKKSFKEYFLEFLMIFLAVTLGFFAENFREHQAEHHQEKEYMATMLEDLKSDIPLLDSTTTEWQRVNRSIDSVTNAITYPITRINMLTVYRHINEALNYWSFTYNDRTIAQLKNSGGFRTLRNKAVANKIIAYDQFNNNAIKNIAIQHNKFFENATALRSRVLLEQVISAIHDRCDNAPAPVSLDSWIDSLINKNKIPFSIEDQSRLLFEFKNSLIALRRDYGNNMDWGYKQQQKMINELIGLIQKEYHLKN